MADPMTVEQQNTEQQNRDEAERAVAQRDAFNRFRDEVNRVTGVQAAAQQQSAEHNHNEESSQKKKGKKKEKSSAQQQSSGGVASDKWGGTNSVYPDHNIVNIFFQMGTSCAALSYDLVTGACVLITQAKDQFLMTMIRPPAGDQRTCSEEAREAMSQGSDHSPPSAPLVY